MALSEPSDWLTRLPGHDRRLHRGRWEIRSPTTGGIPRQPATDFCPGELGQHCILRGTHFTGHRTPAGIQTQCVTDYAALCLSTCTHVAVLAPTTCCLMWRCLPPPQPHWLLHVKLIWAQGQ
ncbi:hypothetical protein JRQ81_006260 [Phrynocephalus forsythii]|uniref:Uncharacterized protein n=1 Tax=Phrynocephalus forsythii TaxID=171643 RepID=A0A9Q1AUE1_9SAUR|nr:hypothetical protein JRQ81_006260 [Phrynocephalus forsythii]